VAAEYVEEVRAFRITMTARLLNRARVLMFLVTGSEKASVLNEVLFGGFDPERLPAQLVRPDSGEVTWIVDQAAAALLPPSAVERTR
jgi:6-phosphogluconolactonase